MAKKPKTEIEVKTPEPVSIVIGSSIPYFDHEGKEFWNHVAETLRRGETVTARLKNVASQIAPTSLVPMGLDASGNPTWGVGAQTKVILEIAIDVDIALPAAAPAASKVVA